ncbi:uncharacterized protein LOC110105109 [Dendrobium catenatum]|uniref:C2 domain-containing protein n=1 Tax=Dendrobium catenatum TaxID=906689 RepID=A0A2I0X641_9ASPA|nr:uncharacterized protein LOC110105109 [Dendrobium catenatum]PKU83389.1 hypothetical protein MA16_Dca016498 [Dendrobium catenatum]
MSEEKRNSELELVVTVLSAESLKLPSSLLLPRHRPRPYVILSTASASSSGADVRQWPPPPPQIHVTHVDEKGGKNPTWNDTVRISVDPAFCLPRRRRCSGGWEEEEDDSAAIHISVLSKRRFMDPTELGWCQILPCHVVDGLRPPGLPRRLSYALRSGPHGGLQGLIHLSVRLVGSVERIAPPPPPPSTVVAPPSEEEGWCQVAIGIPVRTAFSGGRRGRGVDVGVLVDTWCE